MKKVFLLITLLSIGILGLFAKDYKNSAGVIVGSFNGLSYKTFVSDNFAIQADLGFGFISTRGTIKFDGFKYSGKEDAWTFQINPNIYYQKNFFNVESVNIAGFIGIGTSLGYAEEYGSSLAIGKWGLNAITGIEFILNKLPITVGLDFRPGYGLMFCKENNIAINMNIFDWALAASVRYCF